MSETAPGRPLLGGETRPQPEKTAWEKIKASLNSSVGDIVFGMEDGTVSIFGLVFGVAAGSSSSAPVLLAGATGAVAAAVSMMAGAFLDVESERGQAQAKLAEAKARIAAHPEVEAIRVRQYLIGLGYTPEEADTVVGAFKRNPNLMLRYESDIALQISKSINDSPFGHAAWMFLSDLFAASIPVIPFAIWPIGTARLISVGITAALLVLLGIGRARVAHTPVLRTTVETVSVAAAAAFAGLLIGSLLTHRSSR